MIKLNIKYSVARAMLAYHSMTFVAVWRTMDFSNGLRGATTFSREKGW